MLFSWSWLGEYVDLGADREAVAHRLTMAGLPVERMETVGEVPEGVVVARVTGCVRHPNADKLSLCTVDAGDGEPLTIVCGAPNARAGLVSALARIGTVLPGGMKIKKSRIRGEVSFGMLCSGAELGLGDDHDGILDLGEGEPGTPLAEVLGPGDTVLDVDITSNRGDCMSHLGLAREIAAVTGGEVRPPRVEVAESGAPIGEAASVTVDDPADCPRYMGRVVRGVTVGPSPDWLVRRLEAAGQRSISNIVDITNFVLLEWGQPLHAFDLARLDGAVGVRRARSGERLTTLDGVDRELDDSILVITDADRPVALAGIMGGADTEVTDDTRDILIEAAVFHPGLVMRGSRRLRLDTEAALRFRRGVDPGATPAALDRAAALMAELGGGTVAPGRLDARHDDALAPRTVALRPERVGALLGETVADDEIERCLVALGFTVDAASVPWTVGVPGWRRDILEECDLTEEIARIRGYDTIGERQYNASAVSAPRQPREELRRAVSRVLRGFGFHEARTRVLQGAGVSASAGIDADAAGGAAVRIVEPPSREEEALRVSLAPSLLDVVGHNLRHGIPETRVFEIGRTFRARAGEFPEETDRVGLAAAGGDFAPSRERGVRSFGLLDMKGAVESLVEACNGAAVEWTADAADDLAPAGAVGLTVAGEAAGFLWEAPPAVLDAHDLRRPVYVAQVRFDALAGSGEPARYRDLSRFPAVRRDLALVVPRALGQAEVRAAVEAASGDRLESVELFDYYEGKHIPDGHVGLGYSLTFRAPDRTLEEDEVDRAVARVVKDLRGRGIELRDS